MFLIMEPPKGTLLKNPFNYKAIVDNISVKKKNLFVKCGYVPVGLSANKKLHCTLSHTTDMPAHDVHGQ